MVEDVVFLNLLFIVVIIMSVALIIVATLSLGKQLGDIDYQHAMGMNGIRKLQANMNVRKNVGRVLVGFVFFSVSFISLLDMNILIRMWIARLEFLILLVYYVIITITDWRSEYKQLKIIMNADTIDGLSLIRLEIHAINNDLQDLIALYELLKVKCSGDEDLQKYENTTLSMITRIKNLQKMIREKDPAYRFEKQDRLVYQGAGINIPH